MNKYQFKHKTQLGTAYYYCYGDNRFETYLRINMISYKKLEENEESGKNLFKEKDKEIEKLNNIIDTLRKDLLNYLEEWENVDDEYINGKKLMARDVLKRIHELEVNND